MGVIRIQIFLPEEQWHTKHIIEQHINYSTTSTESSSLNLDFGETNSGNQLVYDQQDTVFADMCFSNSMITHSVH